MCLPDSRPPFESLVRQMVQALLALCPKQWTPAVGCQPPPDRQPERKARFPPAAVQTAKPPFLRDSSASSTAELIQVGGATPTREEGVLIDRISSALVKYSSASVLPHAPLPCLACPALQPRFPCPFPPSCFSRSLLLGACLDPSPGSFTSGTRRRCSSSSRMST